MSILLVEPAATLRQLYIINLSSVGRFVSEVSTLASAWHACTNNRIRLLIVELIGFEDGSPFDFLNRLAYSPATAHLPVLVITTLAEANNAVRDLPNVRKMMIKPISRHALLKAVYGVLGEYLIPTIRQHDESPGVMLPALIYKPLPLPVSPS
jgi:DNA-binding response OmpR family regulator